MQMTHFTLVEFNGVWNTIRQQVLLHNNTARGSKSPIKAKDLFFMALAVLQHEARWDLMAYLFGLKALTFEKRVTAMLSLI